MRTAEHTRETVARYPDGHIPASPRYIDYDGQLVIRTRFATIQRWTTAGESTGDRRVAPFILHSDYCRGDGHSVVNDHLDAGQFDVYYVGGETVRYEVESE